MPSVIINLFGERMIAFPETGKKTEETVDAPLHPNQMSFDDLRRPTLF